MSRRRSELGSRALVAVPAIAFALFIVIEGGLVFTIGLFALGCVCMHELYAMYERAHPVRLAGFIALAGLLAGALYGNQFQVLLAAVAALPLLFGLTISQRHPSVGGMALTLLGIYWIGFALAYAVLLRDLPHGQGIVIDVLVGVFLGDTGAYLGGQMFGRRRLAPSISPGKTGVGSPGTCLGRRCGCGMGRGWKAWQRGRLTASSAPHIASPALYIPKSLLSRRRNRPGHRRY